MDIGLEEKDRKKIAEGLSIVLANTYALYLKTQNFHWNLAGTDFYSLHLLFEKQYEELQEAIDEIAERIRALGFYVDGSFSGFKKLTSIQEEKEKRSIAGMLKELVRCHEILIKQGRDLAEQVDKCKEKDLATIDLLSRRLGVHEKFVWMLRSQI